MNHLRWFTCTDTAKFPVRATPGSAGYDLYADEDLVVKTQYHELVKTGVGVIIPHGWYGRIAPRSSLALKWGIQVFAGVIDSDYRLQIGVILHNAGGQDFIVKKGDRIAQIIFERCLFPNEILEIHCTKEEAQNSDNWSSERTGGFGSTGK